MLAFEVSALPEIFRHLIVSIALGVCGLVIGCAIALVLAFLAADNITPNRGLSWFIKGTVSFIRAIPSLVLILMVIASFVGFGYTAGVVGLVISTAGYLTRAFIASIEEQDRGIIESMTATGANRLQIALHGILPGVWNVFLSWISIRLENNIADSISLGIVGAGGVGMLISRAVRTFNLPYLSTVIVVIFVTMVLIELGTGRIKARVK
jgi:phosphonate transport system permease protein